MGQKRQQPEELTLPTRPTSIHSAGFDRFTLTLRRSVILSRTPKSASDSLISTDSVGLVSSSISEIVVGTSPPFSSQSKNASIRFQLAHALTILPILWPRSRRGLASSAIVDMTVNILAVEMPLRSSE